MPHRERVTTLSALTAYREISFLRAPANHRGWAGTGGEGLHGLGGILGIISVLPEDTESPGDSVSLGGARAGGWMGMLGAWVHGTVQGVLGSGGAGGLCRDGGTVGG